MSTPETLRPEEDRGFTATTLLNLWIIALILVPANLVVKPLGGAGSPAQIIGLLAGGWWLGTQFGRAEARPPTRRSYVLIAMLAFVVMIVVSYIVATSRPIGDLELSSADRGILEIFSWLGIFLLVCTEVTSRAALDRTLRLLVILVGVAAALGVTQFLTGISFVDSISIPGLSPNQALTSIYGRNGFARPAGTSVHPIEFGVLLAMTLPIALHYAINDVGRRSRFVRWIPVAAIAIAIPISISRSALIGVVVVLAIVLPGWPARRRRLTYLTIVVVLGTVYIAIPGLLGTLLGLFTGIGTDDSALSRTNSYDLAASFIARAPLLGRGFSTFLPEYRILDNQYLGLLIEIGFIGILIFIGLLLTGTYEASRLAVGGADLQTRALGRSLMAAIVAAACAYATFDALGFNQVASLTFFLLGCVGLLTRLEPVQSKFLTRTTRALKHKPDMALNGKPRVPGSAHELRLRPRRKSGRPPLEGTWR
jgi:O-antigen ligase